LPIKNAKLNFGYGINLLRNFGNENIIIGGNFTYIFSAGFIKEINKKTALNIQYEFDFFPKEYLPVFYKYLSNSIKIGLSINNKKAN
jgi:hypothetical protein